MLDTAAGRVEFCAIERMRHGTCKLLRRIPWQLGVGVERDDIFHGGKNRGFANDPRKGIRATAQQCVQVCQLAALTLITHPRGLAGIPLPRPMKQEELVRAGASVLFVQCRDTLCRKLCEFLVCRQYLAGRIA
ncbi:MAG: hypothetical protein LH632_22985, partial [Rhodoferax sp.]|nr:hypothetical protein [Rhodoferax sp.]